MRKLILLGICFIVILTSCSMSNSTVQEEESKGGFREIVIQTPTPTVTPTIDFDLTHLSIVRQEGGEDENISGARSTVHDSLRNAIAESEVGEDSGSIGESDESDSDIIGSSDESESVSEDYISENGTGEPVSELVESGTDDDVSETGAENYSTGDDGESDSIQTVSESGLTYLGDWTITAYCPCSECCGEWATGYTASGEPAISGHTVACNSLPFYSRVVIDGVEYVVEDTGSTDYGDAWIDIFFDTHEEALAYGVQVREVYLVG